MECGIDISPSMLSHAEMHLRNFDRKCFELRIGNAYQLPFEENMFDLIINNFMFDLLPESDFVAILSEFNRVLKSSGRDCHFYDGFRNKVVQQGMALDSETVPLLIDRLSPSVPV